MSTAPDHWPPAYSIKRHPRAKYVKLRASQKKGLEVIVPPKFNLKQVAEVLMANKKWIQKQLLKIASQIQENDQVQLPTSIFLQAIQQTWRIEYIESDTPLRLIARPHHNVVIMGDIQNKNRCKKILISWLKRLAKTHLPILLEQVSQQLKLSYGKITIRDQQTLWGSCTKDKSISLNYKILFLPEQLAKHILIHELCHTVYLNHSDKFWKLVSQFDPNCQAHRTRVKKADDLIPRWTSLC